MPDGDFLLPHEIDQDHWNVQQILDLGFRKPSQNFWARSDNYYILSFFEKGDPLKKAKKAKLYIVFCVKYVQNVFIKWILKDAEE